MSRRYFRSALVAFIVAMQGVVAGIAAGPAYGDSFSFIVFNLADNTVADGACTLREAMLAANNTPANADCGPGSASDLDRIFIVVPGTIVLGAALPTITQGVFIVGHSSGTTIDGNGTVRPFVINPSVNVTLEKLAITNAKAATGSRTGTLGQPAGDGDDGGAIHNRGKLSLVDVRITHSMAGRGGTGAVLGGSGGRGGAIYNAGTVAGYRVTFDGNSGGEGGPTLSGCCGGGGSGGAIYNDTGATLTLVAATLTGNSTGKGGIPAGEGAALYTAGPVSIAESTFVGNGIRSSGNVPAIVTRTGTVEFAATIMADQPGCLKIGTAPGGFVDRGFNFSVRGAGCGFIPALGSITEWFAPLLHTELQNNGGHVPTFAVLPGSPTTDAVPVSFPGCGNNTDARGVSRPQGIGCDMGAYETGPSFRQGLRALAITGAGSGNGTVSSDGVDCAIDAGNSSGQCSAEYVRGTVVNPTATAAADSIFVGWEGDPECYDGSILIDDDKNCTAIFDLRGLSVRGSADGVGQVPRPNRRGHAEVTFAAEFAFAGAIDLTSATLAVNALLDEDEEGGAGELVAGVPIVLQAKGGASSGAAIFETPGRVTPSFRVHVRMDKPSVATVAMTVHEATLPRLPQLCSLASKPATTLLTTTFTIDDGIHAPVTVTTREPWRCGGRAPRSAIQLRPHSLQTP